MTVVLGADGWLGGILARHLGAQAIPFGPALEAWLTSPRGEIVLNCTGLRVRPGLLGSDYSHSHGHMTRRLAEVLRPGQTLIHFSSASVFGAGSRPGQNAAPASFPCRPYAEAKFEAEEIIARASSREGFRAIILRPAILYAPGGGGMMGTLLGQARQGRLLRVLPAESRHHLCSDQLLGEAVARIIAAQDAFVGRRLVVADPFTITNGGIFSDVVALHRGRSWPLPVHWLATFLRLFPRLRGFDLRTWGEILAIWALDSTYDNAWLWEELGLDPTPFGRENRWRETLSAPL